MNQKHTYWRGWKFAVICLLILFVAVALAGIGRLQDEPYAQTAYYSKSLSRLEPMKASLSTSTALQVGWAKVNITPEGGAPMAGYTPRATFTSVHDSLYARVLTFATGNMQVAIVSVDLLLFPPQVLKKLHILLRDEGLDVQLYPGAIHTHNGIGGWEKSLVGMITMGQYDEALTDWLADRLLQAIARALNTGKSGKLSYVTADASQYTKNRLDRAAPSDGMLRALQVVRSDSSTAMLSVYGAHPTSLPRKSTYLSRDYPGALVDRLEQTHDFALFMAGMVGSQGLTNTQGHSLVKVGFVAEVLHKALTRQSIKKVLPDSLPMAFARFEVALPPTQLHLGRGFVVRDWVHRQIFGELQAPINLLKIGEVVFMGVPADFSGELYVEHLQATAQKQGLQLVVTGFNGGYIGYLVSHHHFATSDEEEVTTMNWLGPQSGPYFVDLMQKILEKVNQQ